MSAFLVITYDVSDAERYAEYNPGSLEGILQTVAKHGGEAVFAGPPDVVTGSMEHTAVCIKFPDADAAKAFYSSLTHCAPQETGAEQPTPEQLERLRSLGYVR